jgi:FlaA1/EpsC-like NDP-sugar epimerase
MLIRVEGRKAVAQSHFAMLKMRRFARVVADSLSWVGAGWLAVLLRFDGKLPSGIALDIFKFNLLSLVLALSIGVILSLYVGKYRNASLEEFLALAVATSLASITLFTIRIFFAEPQVPRSVPIISGFLALIFILVTRVISSPRTLLRFSGGGPGERTLIYGAGIVGRQLAEQMIIQKNEYEPIGFIDDDPAKAKLKIIGRPVLGSIDQLEKIVTKESPKTLLVAISGIESESILRIDERCRALGIKMRVIPTTYEIISGAIKLSDVQDVSEEDLLGRRPVNSDDSEIITFIRGKKVLITGAGGSIGSEIARQVQSYSPLSLTLVDRDETSLLNLQLSLDGTGLLTNENLVLGDIRDAKRMFEIFETKKPDVVFHAAALKHLTTLQRFPEEAKKTNILGTRNVLKAAVQNDVAIFINISTDKAADPTSALGKSKLLTEKMTAGIKGDSRKYISVRFGNVVGSNGSFIHTFRHQIRHGGPITITHPEVTRYFMTVSEAVHLVLHSAIVGQHSETLILEMGSPVRIESIAKRMIEVSGRKIDIKYTGLRPGEKLHESLVSMNEDLKKGKNPMILHTRVEGVDLDSPGLED